MSIRASLLIGLLIALSAPALARDVPENAPREWSMIAFEMKSWGAPLSSWTIIESGGGSWTETVRQPGAAPGAYKLAVHEIEVGERGFAELANILRGLPVPAPDYEACETQMTDMPYGTIRLTRGSTTTEIAWNAGCMDKPYVAFLDSLKAADALVGRWGKAGKLLRTESPRAD